MLLHRKRPQFLAAVVSVFLCVCTEYVGLSPRSSQGILSPVQLAFGPEPAFPSKPMAFDLSPADMPLSLDASDALTPTCYTPELHC